MDHYLGLLAASLGEHGAAAVHLEAAIAQHHHPDLAAHLRAAIRTGTACTCQPAQPVDWTL